MPGLKRTNPPSGGLRLVLRDDEILAVAENVPEPVPV
jgi:hypothetical protein